MNETKCQCISYNKPEWGGQDPEVVLDTPSWMTKRKVCVDASKRSGHDGG